MIRYIKGQFIANCLLYFKEAGEDKERKDKKR